jgi:hypothetical protein
MEEIEFTTDGEGRLKLIVTSDDYANEQEFARKGGVKRALDTFAQAIEMHPPNLLDPEQMRTMLAYNALCSGKGGNVAIELRRMTVN